MQQLFICTCNISGNILLIKDISILNQLRKVFRAKIGVQCHFQDQQNNIRYYARINKWDNKQLWAEIETTTPPPQYNSSTTQICIAYPNKWQKAELIVQKLTEIGINTIIFWPAERSIIKQKNDNKIKRIFTIAKEASEQSRRWNTPKIIFLEDIGDLSTHIKNSKIIIFDLPQDSNATPLLEPAKHITGVIGPEGGLTKKDYSMFTNHVTHHLGSTVLRMETAAIIGGRELTKLSQY